MSGEDILDQEMPDERRRAIAKADSLAFSRFLLEDFEPIELFPYVSVNNINYNFSGYSGSHMDGIKDPIILAENEIVHKAVIRALVIADLSGLNAVKKYMRANTLYCEYARLGHPASKDFDPSVIPGWNEWLESLK